MSELPVSETSADEADRITDEVLRSPDFNYDPTLLERLGDWVGGWLERLLSPLLNFGGGGATGRVIAYMFLFFAVVALVWLIWRLLRDRFPKPEMSPDQPVIDVAPWMRPSDLRKAAEEFEAAGHWREALRARYRLLIAQLVEMHLIENPPGRTSGEYRQVVAAKLPGIAEEFGGATIDFERVWYGNFEATEAGVATMRDRADRLPKQAKQADQAKQTAQSSQGEVRS